MHKFNPVDSALLFLEKTHTPFHVSMIHIYDPSTCPDGPPTFEDIVETIRISLPLAETFRRKIVRVPLDLDYPYWIEDEDFDLEFHMRHIALPRPGNRKQFREQVSRLISRPLDLSRPPWEMTIIEGLDNVEGLPPGCFAMVLKIHHCAIDGHTGVAMITAMHQDTAKKKLKKIADHWQPEPVPANGWLIRQAWVNSIRHPVAIARLLLSNSRALVRAAFEDLRSDDDDDKFEVPDTIFNAPISAHRIMEDVLCPLDNLKRVRHAVEGATINDVCMTVVAEAMRLYLAAKKALPEESLVTTMSISTRTPEQAKGGNQIAITRIPLHTDILDPIERLAAITADTRKKKATKDGVVMSTLLGVVYNLPGALIGVSARASSLASANATAFANTMVTNVPGSPDPLYFLGARCVHMVGALPLMDGGGLAHSVGSYNGYFIFSFTACRDLLPDPDFYRQCLVNALQTVLSAVDGQRTAKPPGKRASRRS